MRLKTMQRFRQPCPVELILELQNAHVLGGNLLLQTRQLGQVVESNLDILLAKLAPRLYTVNTRMRFERLSCRGVGVRSTWMQAVILLAALLPCLLADPVRGKAAQRGASTTSVATATLT
jgi:hypothetical protein